MNIIQSAIAAGRPTYGLWVAAPSASSAEALGRGGLDWLILDMQHGALDASSLLPLIQALELGGSSALVRVPSDDPSVIMRALDLGAIGVVVPMVSTAAQARAAAQATRYPPLGNRSFGPVRSFYDVATASTSVTCLVMIETAEGLENLDEIAATPGVDGLFVGPVDLGLALGEGIQIATQGPLVTDAIARVVAAANAHGIIAGVASSSSGNVETLLAAGVRLVTLGSDMGYVRAGLRADVERTKDWTDRFTKGPAG